MPPLAQLLAPNPGTSPTQARRLLAAGETTDAAGAPLTDPRQNLPVGTVVRVGETSIELLEVFHLMLNKPTGYITALEDDRHPVAYELLRDAPMHSELRSVGRLDLDTTGLLLYPPSPSGPPPGGPPDPTPPAPLLGPPDGPALPRLPPPKRRVPPPYPPALARPFQTPPPGFQLEDGHRPDIQHLGLLDEA